MTTVEADVRLLPSGSGCPGRVGESRPAIIGRCFPVNVTGRPSRMSSRKVPRCVLTPSAIASASWRRRWRRLPWRACRFRWPMSPGGQGVGTGTVSRYFPTKESLYEAIVLHLVGGIVDKARGLSAQNDPGSAFFQFLAHMVEQAAVNRGLAEAMSGAGFDVEAVAFRPERSLEAVESELLTRAQQAGVVRRDITRADVKALLVGLSGPRTSGLRPGSPAAHDRRGVHRPASRTGHSSRRPGACRLSGSFSDSFLLLGRHLRHSRERQPQRTEGLRRDRGLAGGADGAAAEEVSREGSPHQLADVRSREPIDLGRDGRRAGQQLEEQVQGSLGLAAAGPPKPPLSGTPRSSWRASLAPPWRCSIPPISRWRIHEP